MHTHPIIRVESETENQLERRSEPLELAAVRVVSPRFARAPGTVVAWPSRHRAETPRTRNPPRDEPEREILVAFTVDGGAGGATRN